MAPNCHSNSTARASLSHSDEDMTSPAVLPLTLLPAGSEPFLEPGQYPPTGPSPAPPYTEHDLEVVSQNFIAPPPSYTESSLRVIAVDYKMLPHAYDPPSPSLRNGFSSNHDKDGRSSYVEAPEKPSSLQVGVTVLMCFIEYSFSIRTLTLSFRREAV